MDSLKITEGALEKYIMDNPQQHIDRLVGLGILRKIKVYTETPYPMIVYRLAGAYRG